jgi:SNF2 family DNA or RNA helicase
MQINYEAKTNKFLIKCAYEHNTLVAGLPDRRFRKGSRVWAAPALRRNVEYLAKNINNPQYYSKEALDVFNQKRKELVQKPTGEKSFPAWYDFKNPPMAHQKEGLEKFFPLNEAAILYEQGLGKTYTSINLVAAWRMTNHIDSVVVICPSSIKLVWENELDEHCPIPTQRHVVVAGKNKQVERFLEDKTDFQWLIVGIEALSQGRAYEYLERFLLGRKSAIIIDESSRIKTPGKTRTDRCVKAGLIAKKRIILSGTSITQGVEDIYTQYKFLNPDILGYDSFYSFRAQYCTTMQMEVGHNKYVTKIVGSKNEDELIKAVAPYTERVEKKDVLNLPDKIFTNRYVTMNPTQKKLYEDMKDELFSQIDEDIYEVTSVLEQMLRLQQITGGHYPWDDGEQVVPKPIPGKNPKLEELMELLTEISGKVIVWCQYRCEIEMVADRLRKENINFVEFHGGCSSDEKKQSVTRFRKIPDVKVFLATRAAAYGLTLTEASTSVYYSQGYSLEEYAQSQDRIHRIGQKSKQGCNYIHLLCDKTVDTKIMKALQDKKNTADMIYSLMKEEK